MADFDKQLDTSGLTCPMPIMKTKKALKTMSDGEVLHVTITDAGSAEDLPGLLEELGNTLLSSSEGDGKFEFTIKK
jgi:tRNA 2-thiouridine synthesizing protein A